MRASAASTRGHRPPRVEEHADVMAARALFGGEIDDVTEQAAERRAKHVDDTSFEACGRYGPSRKSSRTMALR